MPEPSIKRTAPEPVTVDPSALSRTCRRQPDPSLIVILHPLMTGLVLVWPRRKQTANLHKISFCDRRSVLGHTKGKGVKLAGIGPDGRVTGRFWDFEKRFLGNQIGVSPSVDNGEEFVVVWLSVPSSWWGSVTRSGAVCKWSWFYEKRSRNHEYKFMKSRYMFIHIARMC